MTTHPAKPPSIASLFILACALGIALPCYFPRYSVKTSIPLTFLTACLVIYGTRIVWISQVWPRLLSPLRKLPGPKGGGLVNGHFWTFVLKDPFPLVKSWGNDIPNDGLLRWTTLFNVETVMPTTPEVLRQLLVTESYSFPKPPASRRFLARLIGNGLVVTEGEIHKAQRKTLMPAFQYRHVKDLVPTFWSKSALMIRAFATHNADALSGKHESTLRFSDWVARCTLDIIGATGMGVEFNAIENPDSHLVAQYKRMFSPNWQDVVLEVATNFMPTVMVRWIPLPRNGEIDAAIQAVRNVSRDIIKQKKEKLRAVDETTLHKDILSVALASGDFDDETLVDHTMTFLGAGHETTSSAVQWAMVALAKHKEIQQKLRAEVRSQLPSPRDESSTVTAEEIDSCHYLHAVCAEVLRHHPPVPATQRVATKDTVVAGTLIKEHTLILLCPLTVNNNKALWGTDADEFNPDRWLGENNANSGGAASNFASLTFLHGPRSCIGQSFARWEFACLLASIVGSFEFELDPERGEVETEHNITARPKGGLFLKMREVEGW